MHARAIAAQCRTRSKLPVSKARVIDFWVPAWACVFRACPIAAGIRLHKARLTREIRNHGQFSISRRDKGGILGRDVWGEFHQFQGCQAHLSPPEPTHASQAAKVRRSLGPEWVNSSSCLDSLGLEGRSCLGQKPDESRPESFLAAFSPPPIITSPIITSPNSLKVNGPIPTPDISADSHNPVGSATCSFPSLALLPPRHDRATLQVRLSRKNTTLIPGLSQLHTPVQHTECGVLFSVLLSGRHHGRLG